MSYMVMGYGSYDAPEDVVDIKTEEEAMDILRKEIEEWCDDNDVDIEKTNYCDGDKTFYYGEEEMGVCIIAVYKVPSFKNETLRYLWNAKMELEKADFASEDYKWTLMDNCVDCHTFAAQEFIDKAIASMSDREKED